MISGACLGGAGAADGAELPPPVPGRFPVLSDEGLLNDAGPVGLLFSQIGYEAGMPVRVVLRLPVDAAVAGEVTCRLTQEGGGARHETPFQDGGAIWGAHWRVAEFEGIEEAANWRVTALAGGKVLLEDHGLKSGGGVLWEQTIPHASVGMLERRRHFTKVGAGWQDAGALWVESCAQSGMIIGLEDLLEIGAEFLDDAFARRLCDQICVGCDYLVMTQEKAGELGFPEGAMSHDLHGHERDILPNDANKAVVALMRAVRLLPDRYDKKKRRYRQAAGAAYAWLMNEAKPLGRHGMNLFQRGLPDDAAVPTDEWPTRDLVMSCWAALEMWKAGVGETQAKCVGLVREIRARQIRKSGDGTGWFGHFREFDGMKHTESGWTHGIVDKEFGSDMGGFFPNYLVPVVEMVRLWPKHDDAGMWRDMLEDFANGYLVPACQRNPFGLVPLGIFGKEGPVWFGGTFHGTNAMYGFTAALAMELAELLGKPDLVRIAYDNLQWLAGLNAGITREALESGCVVFSADLPEGMALPASMMCGVGRRWAGTWFQTRGVICNGFSLGKQFKYDVAPTRESDGPHSFTDEDWIPHSAGWVAGLVRLRKWLGKG